MGREERRYCPVCNNPLDENNYCENCYTTIDEEEFRGLERFTAAYNLFFLALSVLTAVMIYLVAAGLFSDLMQRARTEEYFGIRLTIFIYALFPIIVFTVYSLIKTIREALSK